MRKPRLPAALPLWSVIAPIAGWVLLAGLALGAGAAYTILLVAGMVCLRRRAG